MSKLLFLNYNVSNFISLVGLKAIGGNSSQVKQRN